MATRTGDATAELIALLRERCPDVAEETLRRLAEAAGILDSAAGAGGDGGVGGVGGDGGPGDGGPGDGGAGGFPDGTPGADRLRWQKLTLGEIPGVNQFVTISKAPVEVVAAILEFVAGILDVISKLLIAIPDPYRALILAAYKILKDIVDDLLSSGAYVYFDAPGLLSNIATLTELGMPNPDLPKWVAGDKPKPQDPPADGFQNWAFRFRQSFDDAGDTERPIFSDGAPVEAVFIVATGPQIPDIAAFGPLFEKLFNFKAFARAWDNFAAHFPEWPDDPDLSRLRNNSVFPDWHSWTLRDIPQLKGLERLPELLKALLLNVDNVIDLLKKLVQAVKDKVALLRQLIQLLQQVIDALTALSATGLSVLVVVSDEGVDGLVKAFLEAENRPNTDAQGRVLTANAMIGVCFLAGTTELAPVNALPIWGLFGQQRSIEQAYAGLAEDVEALKDQSQAAVSDTAALASTAWKGMENGGKDPSSRGLKGLWGGLTDTFDQQRDEVLGALGLTQEEADEQASANRVSLAAGLELALAEGKRLDPVVLAHVEATRRARRRGRRSLAMSLGPRVPEAPSPEEQ